MIMVSSVVARDFARYRGYFGHQGGCSVAVAGVAAL